MSVHLSCSNRPTVLVICNAIDDSTRLKRRIDTDSPAASRKVFLMAQAMRLAGIRPWVLSLGRGRPDGTGDFFHTKVCRVNGVPTIYASYSHWRGLSELLSFFGLLMSMHRLARRSQRAVVFYNRMPAYLLLLHAAIILEYRRFIDIEDGEVLGRRGLKARWGRFVREQFDRHCDNGALLACSALAGATSVRPIFCYYGTAVGATNKKRWTSQRISCLISGTLTSDTGAPLIIEAIRLLRERQPFWGADLNFEVTGKGDSLAEFERLASALGEPRVHVHGRTTDARYADILNGCEVGLALKPVGGTLADTTFPSKVIEFASHGLLVLSTDISDVRRLLGNGARYIESNDVELLILRLSEIVKNREAARQCATQGYLTVKQQCAPMHAGHTLREFFFGVKK